MDARVAAGASRPLTALILLLAWFGTATAAPVCSCPKARDEGCASDEDLVRTASAGHDHDKEKDHESGIDRKVLRKDALQRRLARQATIAGRTLAVDATVSEMIVHASETGDDTARIVADVVFWSSDKSWMHQVERDLDIGLEEAATEVRVTMKLPRAPAKGWFGEARVHYEIRLVITVPPTTPLDIRNKYGKIGISGVAGPVRVANDSGNIIVQEARGPVVVRGRYGDLRLSEIEGTLEADTTSGNIEVTEVSGNVRIASSYGSVLVEEVGGRLDVTNSSGNISVSGVQAGASLNTSYGSIEAGDIDGGLSIEVSSGNVAATDVQGSVTVRGTYGSVALADVDGDVSIDSGNGDIAAADIDGALSIRGSYANIRADDIGRSLTVRASSSSVRAIDVDGPVDIESSHGNVEVRGANASVRVTNQSGDVSLGDLGRHALAATHEIRTTYGSITVGWSVGAPVSWKIESSGGSIALPFPAEVARSGSRQTAEGSRGRGRGRLVLESRNGSIRLVDEE